MKKIHKTSEIEKGAKIGNDVIIWNNTQVKKGALIGDNCVIGHNCFISDKAVIGNNVKIQSNVDVWDFVTIKDYVFIGPSVVFTNDINPRAEYPKKKEEWLPTLVERGATIGANATILCNITIGKYSMIGAGAVVREDVPDYGIVVGNPGKIVGYICRCGRRLTFLRNKSICKKCKRSYTKKGKKIFVK